MKPTDILKNEHENIRAMIRILLKISASKNLNTEHLLQAIDFIIGYADKCHHGKEEDILFPEMEKAGIPRQNGPIGVMLHEHTLGRNFVKAITEAITEYKAGNSDAVKKITANAHNYAQLLDGHIEKENMILFPMADRVISAELQEILLQQFKEKDNQMSLDKKIEQYLETLKNLSSIYS